MAENERQYRTQMRGGTHKENLVKLQTEFGKIMSTGDVSIRGFHQMLGQLLKSFENLRLESEKQIRRLQDELLFNQGTANACATFSNILVSLINGYNSSGLLSNIPVDSVNAKEEDKEGDKEEEKKENSDNGVKVETDIEALNRVCANCGCQDTEDMKDCDCLCHRGKPCGNEKCIICKDLSGYKLIKKKRGRPRKKKVEVDECQDS